MESVLILLGAVIFSYLLNIILLKFSKNFGVDSRLSQNLVRWSSATKPTTGGISFYLTFLLSFIVLIILKPELTISGKEYISLLTTATLAFLIGFADDAYGTHPLLKLIGQIVCGIILVLFGIQIDFFVFWDPNLQILDSALTVFWVVGLMNSLNMLDNMDAVTGTIALTILLVTMSIMVALEGISHLFFIMIAVVGSFAGFLFLNWKPAKIYMGDTGSMFIGLILAYMGITYLWNVPASPDNISAWRKALVPVLVFLVPIMDTSFVTIARISRGSSPFKGGKDHLTHNLARLGIQEHLVPVTLGIVSLISGTLAFYIFYLIPEWDHLYSILFSTYPIGLFILFVSLYRQGTRIGKMRALIALHEEKVQESTIKLEQKTDIPEKVRTTETID